MQIYKKTRLTIAAIMITALTGMPSLVLAHNQNGSTSSTASGKPGNSKLAEIKHKVCQKREKQANSRVQRTAAREQKQLDRFSSIAEKTEKRYAAKGKTVRNYDQLVNDVNTKKAAAQAAIDKIKATSVSLKCDGTDPKGAAANAKDVVKAETVALKDYKTSVRNLIAGIKPAHN